MSVTTSFRPIAKAPLVARSQAVAVLLLLGDLLGLWLCWEAASWLRHRQFLDLSDPFFYLLSGLVISAFYLAEAYRPETQIVGLRAPFRIVLSGVIVAGVIASLIYLFGVWGTRAFVGRGVWLPGLILFLTWAAVQRIWMAAWLQSRTEQRSWLILGLDENALQFVQASIEQNALSRFVVLTAEEPQVTRIERTGLTCVSRIEEFPNWSKRIWSGILISTDLELSDRQVRQLMDLRLQGIPVYRLPDFYETLWYKLPADLLKDDWFAFSAGFNLLPNGINSRFKRLFDIAFTGTLLVLLAPLMLLTAVIIKLESRGPVFYSQMRTGLNRQPFRVYKFRSMRQDAEKLGIQWAKERDPRITRVGYWLRLTRIDELPQLWNVLRGDMSLIGPRPERPEFDVQLAEAIPYYNIRYLVKPGITGWAQVMYPYGASVEDAYEKLAYDLYYIKNYSIWLDLAIAFKTLRVVLLGKGR